MGGHEGIVDARVPNDVAAGAIEKARILQNSRQHGVENGDSHTQTYGDAQKAAAGGRDEVAEWTFRDE